MGIDVHAMNHLINVHQNNGAFKRTITLGRQGVHLRGSSYQKDIDKHIAKDEQEFCEAVLTEFFGASQIDSMDNSNYENATLIHDMNKAIPESLHDAYDTVIDVGTLEHVFDIGEALRNCAALCKVGGQIIHILPTNGFCGHGFWQFSPELFFSLYSAENGFENTQVYVAERWQHRLRYAVARPNNGIRVNLLSDDESYIMVHTQKTANKIQNWNVQQSDYVMEWSGGSAARELSIQHYKSRNIYRWLVATLFPKFAKFQMKSISAHNPNLTAEKILPSIK